MYGRTTTGKPVKVISTRAAAHSFRGQIDTKKNEPLVHDNKQIECGISCRTEVTSRLRAVPGKAGVGRRMVGADVNCQSACGWSYHT